MENPMASGVLVFKGMRVGVQDGDLTIEEDESGAASGKLILSTAYSVLPLWLRVADDELRYAKTAAEAVASRWSSDDEINRELLVAELEPSMQVAVACGIALDAMYDQLRPYAKLTNSEIQKMRDNKTKRAAHITEIIRRVYKIDRKKLPDLTQKVESVISYRDRAVHPSFKLERTCTRPDIPVGVDWKFSLYRYSNAKQCLVTTMTVFLHLYEKKSGTREVDEEMERIVAALEQLNLIQRKASAITCAEIP